MKLIDRLNEDRDEVPEDLKEIISKIICLLDGRSGYFKDIAVESYSKRQGNILVNYIVDRWYLYCCLIPDYILNNQDPIYVASEYVLTEELKLLRNKCEEHKIRYEHETKVKEYAELRRSHAVCSSI